MVLLSWFIRRCNVSALMGRSGKPVGVICPGRNGSTSSSSPESSSCGDWACVVILSSSFRAGVAGDGCRLRGGRIRFSDEL